jgi:hypothetical protein
VTSQVWLAQVGALHAVPVAGQSVGATQATHEPAPSQTWPPLVAQALPLTAFTVAQAPAGLQTALAHAVPVAGQSVGATQATHEPAPSQTWPPLVAQALPLTAFTVAQAPAGLQTALAHAVPVAGQSVGATQATHEPVPLQTWPPLVEHAFPLAAFTVAHSPAGLQIALMQVVPVAGQSVAGFTQWGAALPPPPHAVRATDSVNAIGASLCIR